MAKRKLCTSCNEHEKKRGNARHCLECWLATQPTEVQIRAAIGRSLAVPRSLHLARVPEDRWPPGRRWCAGCQSFVRLIDCAAKATRCRGCVAAMARAYRLEREYSLTQAEYDRLFAAQDGRCHLCRRRSIRVPLAVDHDHRTGEVRGLLCPDPNYGCNLKVVARFDADPDPLAMALRLVDYLRNPPARKILHRD